MRERLLHRIASQSDHPDYKHAALIIEGNRILAMASNLASKHAEIRALRKMPGSGKGRMLVSSRTGAGGALRMALPCAACMKAIKQAGIKTVRYSDEKGMWMEIEL